MIRCFNLQLLLVLSASPSDMKPATNLQSNRSYRKHLEDLPGGAIVPIEAWLHNDVTSVRGKSETEVEEGENNIVSKKDPMYGEEEEEEEGEALGNEREEDGSREMLNPGSNPLKKNEILGISQAAFGEGGVFARSNVVDKEDPWYGEEEEETLVNEREEGGPREPLMQNGILDYSGVAKAAFQSLRGDTAEKLQLPEDRKRLIELVRRLIKPNLASLTTPHFVQTLLDGKTELNIALSKDSSSNEENEKGDEGEVEQHQKPQPVLLLLKGWLVHV